MNRMIDKMAGVIAMGIGLVIFIHWVGPPPAEQTTTVESACRTEYAETAQAYLVTFCDENRQEVVYRHSQPALGLKPLEFVSSQRTADLTKGRQLAYMEWPELQLSDAMASAEAPEPVNEPTAAR